VSELSVSECASECECESSYDYDMAVLARWHARFLPPPAARMSAKFQQHPVVASALAIRRRPRMAR
jgi:hypothetical protein